MTDLDVNDKITLHSFNHLMCRKRNITFVSIVYILPFECVEVYSIMYTNPC